jgi:hypothetical protein
VNAPGAPSGAAALHAALAAEGGTLAEVLVAADAIRDASPGPAQLAAAGPRTRGREAEYELLIEMILEGARLHYGRPRVLAPADPDLALLLGDQLYALGLSRLAALGDLEATAQLADVISLIAQAHAGSDPALADAVWEAGAAAIGWGRSRELEAAKALARAEDPRAAAALRDAAARLAGANRRVFGEAPVSDGRRDVDDTLREPFNSGAV